MIIKNVQIKDTMLGIEDHGIFTFMLHLMGDGWGIGYGGYALDQWMPEIKQRLGTAKGMRVIAKILETLKVDSWEKLRGQYIRVQMTDEFGTVEKIGHLLNDKWFSVKEFYEGQS